jgi:hypothetical protein
MGEIWKANEEVHDLMRELVGKYHPDLALVVDEIIVVFTEKGNKAVVQGSASRVSPWMNLFGGTSYKFMIVLPADKWENEMTSKEREILLNHHLFSCRAEEDPNSGDIKCSMAKPDVIAFAENVEIYGQAAMFSPKQEEENKDQDSDED